MLEQRDRCGCAVGNRVGHVPDVGVVEDAAVLERLRARDRRELRRLLVTGAEPDQSADERTERL